MNADQHVACWFIARHLASRISAPPLATMASSEQNYLKGSRQCFPNKGRTAVAEDWSLWSFTSDLADARGAAHLKTGDTDFGLNFGGQKVNQPSAKL